MTKGPTENCTLYKQTSRSHMKNLAGTWICNLTICLCLLAVSTAVCCYNHSANETCCLQDVRLITWKNISTIKPNIYKFGFWARSKAENTVSALHRHLQLRGSSLDYRSEGCRFKSSQNFTFPISNLKDVGSNPESSKSITFCLHK